MTYLICPRCDVVVHVDDPEETEEEFEEGLNAAVGQHLREHHFGRWLIWRLLTPLRIADYLVWPRQ